MALDSDLATLALRTRALSLTVCTTGSATLAATATGYTRLSGSFITDGFRAGMDVVSSGFSTSANNMTGVVTGVTALTLTVSPYVVTTNADGSITVARPATVVEASASGRTIAAKLPSRRAWELVQFTPATGIPYVTEQYVPGGGAVMLTAPYAGGLAEELGMYVLTWYGLSGSGTSAIRKSIDALKALFAPGTTLTVGTDRLTVRGAVGPSAGSIITQDGGFAACALTISWRAETTNAIAA